MDIRQFMQKYQDAREPRDDARFAARLTPDGEYHTTPFAVQRGHAQLAECWRRVSLQDAVQPTRRRAIVCRRAAAVHRSTRLRGGDRSA